VVPTDLYPVVHLYLVWKLAVLYAAAAEIAVDLMWQEDFSHALCRMLSWHACHLRLAELLATPTPEVTEEQEPESPPAEDEEVVFQFVCIVFLVSCLHWLC